MMRKGAVCFARAVLIFFFFSVSLTFLSPKSTFYCTTLFGLIIRKETDDPISPQVSYTSASSCMGQDYVVPGIRCITKSI